MGRSRSRSPPRRGEGPLGHQRDPGRDGNAGGGQRALGGRDAGRSKWKGPGVGGNWDPPGGDTAGRPQFLALEESRDILLFFLLILFLFLLLLLCFLLLLFFLLFFFFLFIFPFSSFSLSPSVYSPLLLLFRSSSRPSLPSSGFGDHHPSWLIPPG